jgi:glycosyltransferase involved in cell wall biosynthesis
MKIVLTIHHFPPNYSAGAEIYTCRLAQWLVRHGHEVEVVCVESIAHVGDGEIEYRHEIYEDVSVWRLYFNLERAPDPFRWSFENPAIEDWLAQFLRQVQPDIVHVNSCYLLSAGTIKAVKAQLFPLVVTLHDFWFVCPRITLLKPTGALCRVPEDVAECAWCLATERRRFRWPEIVSGGAAGAVAQRMLKLPAGSTLLGIQPDADEIAYRRKVLMNALNQADIILSPSEFLRTIFVEQGLDPAKILYSRYGLDTSHWLNPSDSERESSEDLRVAYIGQLAPHKGVHLLVKAFNRLNFARRQARLKIYGDLNAFPDYVESLRKTANSHVGQAVVEFAGRFDNRQVAGILHQTDVVVVPSLWYENSPITIMEALTTGTPVITTNIGGMPELVKHNVNGLLFAVGDVGDLARQLQRMLDEPSLVTGLAANAQPVRMIDDEMIQILSLYERVVGDYASFPA